MKDQEYNDFMTDYEHEARELDRLRSEFMSEDYEVGSDLNSDLGYAKIGVRVSDEDTTLNIYELYHHADTRAKLWGIVARVGLHYAKLFPTEERLRKQIDSLERHYQNIITKLFKQADKALLADLLDNVGDDLPKDMQKALVRDMVIGGLAERD